MFNLYSNVKNKDEQDYEEGELPDDMDVPQQVPPVNQPVKQNDSESDVIYEIIPAKNLQQQPRKKEKKAQKVQSKGSKNNKVQKNRYPSEEGEGERQPPQLTQQPMSLPFYPHPMQSMYPKPIPFYPMIYQNMSIPMGYPSGYPPNYGYLPPMGPPGYVPKQVWQNPPNNPPPPTYRESNGSHQNKYGYSPPRPDPRKVKLGTIKSEVRKNLESIKQKQDLLNCLKLLMINNEDEQSLKKIGKMLENESQKIYLNEILNHLQLNILAKKIKQRKLREKLLGQNSHKEGIKKLLDTLVKDPRKKKQ